MTGFHAPVSPSPYEQMISAKPKANRGRPALSEWQRDQRRKATNLANRRAAAVIRERHKDEWNAVTRAERAALFAVIDTEYATSPDAPRDLWDIVDGKK